MEQVLLRPEGTANDPEIIDLEQFTKEGKDPSTGSWYRVKVGTEYFILLHHLVTGREILKKAGLIQPECHWLYQKFKDCDFKRIGLDDQVNLTEPGIEHFAVKPTEVFNYFVDAEPETTDAKELTPDQILKAAGISPVSDYYLVRINADGTQLSYKDSADKPIMMVCPAVKFVSAFRGETPVS